MAEIELSCNVNHPVGEYSVCIGKITSKIQRPDSILIDGRINGDTYVVLGNSGLDRNFRSSMETAPLNNQFNLFLYDHMSTVVGKYLKDRPTNKKVKMWVILCSCMPKN